MLFNGNTYKALNEARNKVVVIPIGATEQHGPHLATGTDTIIVTHIAKAVEKVLSEHIVLAPSLPYGSSDHHLSFGGTISITADLYTQVLVNLVSSLVDSGFTRIVLLNGHGGNITPAKQALALLSKKYDTSHRPNIALVTYWELGGKAFAGEAPMESPALSHACEYETSMMLFVQPGSVFMNEVQRADRPEQNGYIPWEDDISYKGVTLFKQTAFISSNGSSGEPQLGTAEKGQFLIDKAIEATIAFLSSFKNWPFNEPLSK
ncbi:MAG: creatininase family protein [Chitinophagaceae bacterium]|uniref:creatininase family protein n=1 Tax=unclassified Paraflavitalea TaxID=2798305 RepID=UPI003D335F49|nr:creatininase family protein [Chitinophagaceae bacterium]